MPTLTTGEKKFLTISAVVAVVFVAVVAGSVFALTSGHTKPTPYLQALQGDTFKRVQASKYCEKATDVACSGDPSLRSATKLAVPVDQSILISVPREISSAAWRLVVETLRPDGSSGGWTSTYASHSKSSVIVKSKAAEPTISIEVQLIAPIVCPDCYYTRGIWSINTTPPGLATPSAS